MAYFENQEMIEIQEQEVKRPTFLTVICILTFVGCGIGLILGLFAILSNNAEESLKMSMDMQRGNPMGEAIIKGLEKARPEYLKWTTISNYTSLVGSILCGIGAILMWKLRKSGFFLYLPGQIIPLIGSIGSYIAIKNVPVVGTTTLIFVVLMALVSVGFVIMYSVNLKHMR